MFAAALRRATLAVGLAGLVACSAPPTTTPNAPAVISSGPSALSSSPALTPSPSARAARIDRLLDQVKTTAGAPYQPGYDRSCDGGGACHFGQDWTDRHPGKFGRNGCTTREDVLLQQMRDIELRWGSTCRIFQASLVDPYTAEQLTWRDDGYWIQIDHIYPLAEAWHAGAWAWPQRKRVRFANDVDRELLAVSGSANQDKGSQTPSEWLPPNQAFRCEYVAQYLAVAEEYALTIRAADQTVAKRVGKRC